MSSLNSLFGGATILGIIIIIVILIFAIRAIRIIRPHERGVVERLGKFQRTWEPGLHLLVPFIDRVTKVDMRENVVDVPPQEVITKDNVAVTVDAVVYYEATDPFKLIYNVTNFYLAATKLAQTNLRNVIGEMQLDESLTSREKINVTLRNILDDATDKWGVRVVRVELQRIEPPADVTQAMHRQMKAERDRRAMILEAEGDKTAAIARAEGARQSRILEAEGTKQSAVLEAEGRASAIKEIAAAERAQKILVAEGEAQGIRNVFGAIHDGQPTDDLLAIRYIDALRFIANGNATKIFMPLELQGMSNVVASVGEIFKTSQEDAATKE
jgi:HflK protein